MLLLVVLSAFEMPSVFGPSAAMLAGCAVPGVQNGLALNPALSVGAGKGELHAGYSRPYRIDGLDCGRIGGGWHRGPLTVAGGWGFLSFGRYVESDAQICVGFRPLAGFAAGFGVRALVLDPGGSQPDVVPVFDVGMTGSLSTVGVGLVAQRVNSPRWRDETELPARAVVGLSWHPVDALLLAIDLSKEPGVESAAFGAELRMARQLMVRFGVGVAPLRLAGGTTVQLGLLGVDYAYQFHQSLGDTHTLGLRLTWH